MPIKSMKLADGSTILVEVDSAVEHDFDINELLSDTQSSPAPSDLPPGAEATGLFDDVIIGGKLLQETISGAAQATFDSLRELKPDEWSVELNIGFESTDKGIVSYLGKGNGSLKVTAKWKKSDDKPTDTSANT